MLKRLMLTGPLICKQTVHFTTIVKGCFLLQRLINLLPSQKKLTFPLFEFANNVHQTCYVLACPIHLPYLTISYTHVTQHYHRGIQLSLAMVWLWSAGGGGGGGSIGAWRRSMVLSGGGVTTRRGVVPRGRARRQGAWRARRWAIIIGAFGEPFLEDKAVKPHTEHLQTPPSYRRGDLQASLVQGKHNAGQLLSVIGKEDEPQQNGLRGALNP